MIRTVTAGAAPVHSAAAPTLLQRCACGGSRASSGECEACRARRRGRDAAPLHRRPAVPTRRQAATAPATVDRVLASSGRALQPELRSDMEARLGRSFAAVRIHDDVHAARAARDVNARAWTVGSHIAFNHGEYSPHTLEGRRLLVHELVHVMQGNPDGRWRAASNIRVQPSASAAELEADRIAAAVVGAEPAAAGTVASTRPAGALSRKIALDDPAGLPRGAPAGQTKEVITRDYVQKLCPEFTVTGDRVHPRNAKACVKPAASAAPVACACMCDMHALRDSSGNEVTWTISVDDDDWPHTDRTTRTVTVHSPFSGVEFGAWSPGDPAASPPVPVHLQSLPNWLVLGHELCGHAHLFAQGTHPTGPAPSGGGRPSHDPTVDIENRIAAEHGTPASQLRGLFADPHHGESVATVMITGFPSNSADTRALPAAGQAQLDTAERFAMSAPVLLDVVGHTDRTGTPTVNADVSRRRATGVRGELRRRGVDAGRFRIVRGEAATECTAPGDQPDCRRVEVRMFIMEGGSIGRP